MRELHILRPDRMKVIPGLDGWPEGYEYTVGGRSVRFVDDVVAACGRSCTCACSIPRTITTA